MTDFKLPDASTRVSIVGRTGSGKTRFGFWLFSYASFKTRPYYVLDFKREGLIAQIPWAHEIGVKDKLSRYPGLYIVRPHPSDFEDVENFLWKLWEKENSGVFIDEGYMIDKRSPALMALLTQGRSKKIPMYILTQRPVECSRFIFSEASYHACFHLTDVRDHKTVEGYTPFDLTDVLPPFHARWYDVARDWSAVLKPVPDDGEILDRFERELKPKKRAI